MKKHNNGTAFTGTCGCAVKPKFKAGDKVKVVANAADYINESMKALIGKVCTVHRVLAGKIYELEESKAHLFGTVVGYYRWDEEWLEPVKNTTKKLIVTTDGETTTAKLIDGKQTIKTAEAKCSKDDEFCFETGAQIAVDRLLDRKPAEPEKPKFTKADLKDGMFGFNMVHKCEDCQWFVVCNGSFVYETGGFDRIDNLDDSMRFSIGYGYVGTVIDGAVSFDNARGMYKRGAGIVYERK